MGLLLLLLLPAFAFLCLIYIYRQKPHMNGSHAQIQDMAGKSQQIELLAISPPSTISNNMYEVIYLIPSPTQLQSKSLLQYYYISPAPLCVIATNSPCTWEVTITFGLVVERGNHHCRGGGDIAASSSKEAGDCSRYLPHESGHITYNIHMNLLLSIQHAIIKGMKVPSQV